MLRRTAASCMVVVVVVVATFVPPVKGQSSDLDALVSLSSGITPKDPSWSKTTPACQWKNVDCDATGSVREIHWSSMGLN